MTSPDRTKLLQTLLSRLRQSAGAEKSKSKGEVSPIAAGDAIIHEFLRSFLLWESTVAKADAALKRLESAVVDMNELRVCLIDEVVGILGPGYPKSIDRATRLRTALNDLYKREHAVSLAHLANRSKRDARAYLEGLNGSPPYVAARVMLVSLDAHAIPVDERLVARLVESDVLEAGATPETAGAFLERAIRSGDGAGAHALLQAWSDEGGAVVVKLGKASRPRAAKPKRATASLAKRSPVARRR